MSTCDAQMVVGSGLFTENIYRRYWVKYASEKHYLWVGRFAGLGIVALALGMLTQFDNVIQVLTTYIQAFPTFMGIAFWFGLMWRGFTPAAVWTSTIATASMWYLTQSHKPLETIAGWGASEFAKQNIDYLPGLFRHWLYEIAPSIMNAQTSEGVLQSVRTRVPYQILLYLSTGVVVGVLTSIFSRRVPQEKLDHFFSLIRTPVTPGEVVVTPCTLPEDHLPAETAKLISHPDLEIPLPTKIGMIGFFGSWVMVGVVIGFTYWLASLGG
jgi:Na+/proline symporter